MPGSLAGGGALSSRTRSSEAIWEAAEPGALNSIQLQEILNLAGEALNRVQPAFFETFREEEAVAYFYEPFLEAFDPQLRKDLGVWYTPKEIVQYMVERVDHLLRTELASPWGWRRRMCASSIRVAAQEPT